MGTVTEDDLVDAHVTSRWGTIGVKLEGAQERVAEVVYTRDRKPLLPILLAIVIAGALVAQTSFAAILGLGALLILLVREVQR